MNRIANRSWIVIVVALALVAGTVFFAWEYVTNGRDWAMFAGSPYVYSGSKLSAGLVTDRAGELLLNMNGGMAYSQDPALRQAMLHWIGDRDGNVYTPYYDYYTVEMVGYDLLNGVYAYGGGAGQMQLTLSGEAMKVALEAMGDRKGTVAVYNYMTGEILCALSTPTFDPDDPPDLSGEDAQLYDGIYLNRFMQSAYLPGSIFKIVTAAAALEIIPDIMEQTFTCTGKLEVGGGSVTCESYHGTQNLRKALTNSCNCAFAQIALQIGGEKLQQYADAFGITSEVSFDGWTTTAGQFEGGDAQPYGLAWSGIGQYTDLVNPCQYLSFMGAIAGGGVGAKPYVVESIVIGDTDAHRAETQMGQRIMSLSTARTIQELMRGNVEGHYGVENFPDVWVCAKTGTGELDGDIEPNATLCGYVLDERYPLAFMVVVQEGGYGRQTCIPIITPVLEACMDVLDRE